MNIIYLHFYKISKERLYLWLLYCSLSLSKNKFISSTFIPSMYTYMSYLEHLSYVLCRFIHSWFYLK